MRRNVLPALTLALLTFPALAEAPKGQQATSIGAPVALPTVKFAISKAVRDLPEREAASSLDGAREVNKKNSEVEFSWSETSLAWDEALKAPPEVRRSALAMPLPLFTFEGIADSENTAGRVNPPDPNGDVGPNHFIEMVNSRTRIFDKAGTPLKSFNPNELFEPLGGACFETNDGDPIVLYDRMADRWLLSQFGVNVAFYPYHQCIAISQTSDPLGEYYLYDVGTPAHKLPDYPKMSVWPDGYYMTTREFDDDLGGAFVGHGAFAFERAKMLHGDPTAIGIYFAVGSGVSLASSGMLPTDHDGILPPPAGAPNVFAIYNSALTPPQTNSLRLFNFHADYAVPGNSTFTERPESPLAVAAFDPRNPGGRADIEVPPAGPPGSQRVDSIGDRLMYRLAYFNRNGVESLVTNHTVNVSGVAPGTSGTHQAAPRFYELRKSAPGDPYAMHDQGTFSPDAGNGATGTNRWMASAAIDNQGNLALGYSASSTTLLPSIYYAGRDFNVTGVNLNQGEALMFLGLGTPSAPVGTTNNGNRWGDYTSLMVDPVDDCTFWHTNQYWPLGNTLFNWKTRIGAFKFPSCTAPAQGTLTGTATLCESGATLSHVMVEVTGGPSSGFSATTDLSGLYSMQLAPGTYSVRFLAPSRDCDEAGPFEVTITAGATTTQDACLTGSPIAIFDSYAIRADNGDGDGVVEKNECNSIDVVLKNVGCDAMENVSVTLSTSTSGATITDPTQAYADIAVDGTGTNLSPFTVNTDASFVCGTPIAIDGVATYDGGSLNFSFVVPTCTKPTQLASGVVAAGDPLTTAGRTFRDGTPSTCAGKTCPGRSGTAPRAYDTHSFTNDGPIPACVTIRVSSVCGLTIVASAYIGSFDPTDVTSPAPSGALPGLCLAQYAGDAGFSSSGTVEFGATVPAGATLVVVIMDVTGAPNCAYDIAVDGLLTDDDGGGVGLSTVTVDKTSLWPPNHKMQTVAVSYSTTNVGATCSLGVTSNEPINGTGDGDTDPDWIVNDANSVQLRAERAGTGTGRIYTITATCTDPCGNQASGSATVRVDHNITQPESGLAVKVGSSVSFGATFRDMPGLTHTANWSIDGATAKGAVKEPSGNRAGTVTGSNKFNSTGVYSIKSNVTNSKGVTSTVDSVNGAYANVVVYDPNGGFVAGGGTFDSPAGAYAEKADATGKVNFGFVSKYFKNATNPKGETQFDFNVAGMRFNAVNFDYLAISGARAQYKGFGKINGVSGYNFILTVVDGQGPGGDGVDKIRMKIWDKTTGNVVYDSQPGDNDTADPRLALSDGRSVMIESATP